MAKALQIIAILSFIITIILFFIFIPFMPTIFPFLNNLFNFSEDTKSITWIISYYASYFMAFIYPILMIVVSLGFIIIGRKSDNKFLKVSYIILIMQVINIFLLLLLLVVKPSIGINISNYVSLLANLILFILLGIGIIKSKNKFGKLAVILGISLIIAMLLQVGIRLLNTGYTPFLVLASYYISYILGIWNYIIFPVLSTILLFKASKKISN